LAHFDSTNKSLPVYQSRQNPRINGLRCLQSATFGSSEALYRRQIH